MQFGSSLLKSDHIKSWWKFQVDSRKLDTFPNMILYGIHSLNIFIRQGVCVAYRGLGITHLHSF